MLMKIDSVCNKVPSRMINFITLGRKGQSMCGRLYLHQRDISQCNLLVNTLIFVIDLLEPNHCRKAARYYEKSLKKEQ